MSITFDGAKREIYIHDLGTTFRRVFAVGAKGYSETGVRDWRVVYKGVRIATIKVKDTHLKGNKNADTARRTENQGAFAKAFAAADAAFVAFDRGQAGTDGEQDRQPAE